MAQRDYLPKLSDVPVEVDEDEETIKIVQLVKSQDPLVIIMIDELLFHLRERISYYLDDVRVLLDGIITHFLFSFPFCFIISKRGRIGAPSLSWYEP